MRGYIFTKKERELILRFLKNGEYSDEMRLLAHRIGEYHRQIIFDFKLMLKVLAKRMGE